VHERTVPLDPAVAKVGERFIETAVQRRHLRESWRLVAPSLREGFTLNRWETGNIPVVPFPADTSSSAPYKVEYSYRDSALLVFLLRPKPGDGMKPQLFHLGARAFGAGKHRHWLVDSWMPSSSPSSSG
jgi:hypothetical protein